MVLLKTKLCVLASRTQINTGLGQTAELFVKSSQGEDIQKCCFHCLCLPGQKLTFLDTHTYSVISECVMILEYFSLYREGMDDVLFKVKSRWTQTGAYNVLLTSYPDSVMSSHVSLLHS